MSKFGKTSNAPLLPCQLCGDTKGKVRDACVRPYRRTFFLDNVARTVCYDCFAFVSMKRCKTLMWEQLIEARQSGAMMRSGGTSQQEAVKQTYLKIAAEGTYPAIPLVAVRAGVARSTAEAWIRKMVISGEITRAEGGRKINVVLRAEHNCTHTISDINERIDFYAEQVTPWGHQGPPTIFHASPFAPERHRKEWQVKGPLMPPAPAIASPAPAADPLPEIVRQFKDAWKRRWIGLYLPLEGAASLTPAKTKKPKDHSRQYEEQFV